MDKETNRSSIKKNIGYQTIYQVLITCLPLITAPYLARVLGVTQQGVYSFTNSIVRYFTLFAMLGISNHGTRSIAEAGSNRTKRSEAFRNIYSLQFLTSIITLLLYLIYVIFLCKENKDIATIQSLAILACVFDIYWLFFGVEQFKTTVTRNIIVRVSVVALILLLVKKPEDLWIYAALMCGSTLVSNIVLWVLKRRLVDTLTINIQEAKNTLKPVLVLFVPLLAMTVYHVMDSTMLGILSDYDNCGYYYNADKVINIPLGIITGMSTVLFPRMVAIIKQESDSKYQKIFSKSVEAMIMVSAAMSFGIAAIANEFTPFFFGKGFEPCISLIIVMAPVMIIKSISSAIRYQYLVPKKKEKYLTWGVFAGAIANLIANLLLIPPYGAMGATLGTLIAEGVACVTQIIFIRRDISILPALGKCIPYLLIAGVMFAGVRGIASILTMKPLFQIIIEVFVGGIIFVLLCLLYSQIGSKENVVNDLLSSYLKKKKIRQ